jgi:probable rRNA maturation factor
MPTSGTPKLRPSRAPELALTVQYGIPSARLPSRARLREWARAALRRNAAVTLRIVGAREARGLNRRFRGRDYATNVLTFAYPEQRPLAGDIAICAPVAAREARARGIGRDAHYAHLVIHGMLHLQGFDHEIERDARRMEQLERRLLAKLGFGNPCGDSTRQHGRHSP